MALLHFDRVTKNYRSNGACVTALAGVSLEAAAGQFVAVVGRSGCGKSTLLNLAGAMDFPTSGEVRIEGVSTGSLDDSELTRLRRSHVGFIFQFFQLLPTLTAVENVELPLLLARRGEARERAMDRLQWVGMADLAHRYPHQLSGGEMQRVAVARALVHSPRLLLADEPIGNLDTVTGNAVVELLRHTVSALGTTVLMATHSRESVGACDTILHLRDGRIEEIEHR